MDPAPPAPPPATCPRCRRVALDDQPLIRHCGRCKGSWISEQALHEHVAHARGGRADHGLSWHQEARAALMCAVCAEPMETLVVRDTAVDRCPRHGVWFDAKELTHVLALAAAAAPVAVAAAAAAAQRREQESESIVPDLVEEGAELAIDAAYAGASGVEAVADAAYDAAGGGDGAADGIDLPDVSDAADAADLADGAAEAASGAADLAAEAAEASGGVFEVVAGGVGWVAEAVVDVVAGIFSALD